MTEYLSRIMDKGWFLIAGVIIATGMTSTCTIQNHESSKRMSEFEESIKEYNTLVAELDVDLAAYRASMPVFGKFSDVCVNRIMPLVTEGNKAGEWLSAAKERGLDMSETPAYDREQAGRAAIRILGSIYRDVYSEFQKAIEAGQLTLPGERDEIYYKSAYHHLVTMEEPLSGRLKDHYPYDKGTPEYYRFVRDLGQVAIMASSPLAKMIYQIPPELEEKQRKVNELYEQLIQKKGQSKTIMPLPEKYKEGYLKKLEDEFSRIGQAAKSPTEAREISENTQAQKSTRR